MKKAIRLSVVSAALAGMLLVLAPPAQAQVRVEGHFRLPHGSISVGVGDRYYYGSPAYPVGSYVPYGYRVIRQPRFGYGFYSRPFACRVHGVYHSHWIPVRSYGRRYIVVARPIAGDPYYDFNREYWDRSYHPYDH